VLKYAQWGQIVKQIKTISIKCDCDKTIDFHELQSFQGGLKEHTESDYEKAKKSILQYGWSFVLYYWNDGKKKWIIDGHNRCEVLSRLEAEGYIIPPIPAIEVFCKNRKEAKQKLLRLNSTFGRLSKESVLEFAEDIDLNFDEIALPDSVIDFTDATGLQETEGDDEAPEVDEKSEPVSKRGEMYELGNSILMCGDSTDAEDVARLMGGEKADMVFTDPPYGVSAVGGRTQTKEKLGMEAIKNDELRNEELTDFLVSFIRVMQYKEKASIYICYPWATQKQFTDAILKCGLKIKNCIIWDKKVFGLNGHKGYRPQYEMIYFCCEKDFEWYGTKPKAI
jgi:hypothetical protein